MAFNEMVAKAQTYFPDLQIKYKDQDTLMKIIGKLFFFNPDFMTNYTTTIGHTIYFPNQKYLQDNQQGMTSVFIHECTHMYDERRVGSALFKLSYLFPQILAPIFLFILLMVGCKWLALLALLFLAPLPAPFRAYFEKRAYFVTMLVSYTLFKEDPEVIGAICNSWFRNGSYYWMWPFGYDKEFAQEAVKIKSGKSSTASEDILNAIVNDLMTAAKV